MNVRFVGNIAAGQDGAIFGPWLFRLGNRGECSVYRLDQQTISQTAAFRLDRWETVVPHSNSVMFGCEYYDPADEFPLLYSNVYNNYAKAADPLTGVCCVYRITRQGEAFSSQLVQMIRIGFTADTELWCSSQGDIRPYGNFTIDREQGIYYGFTMRDGSHATRYFAFPLPKLREGCLDAAWGVPVVTLEKKDIQKYFDCPYHRFLQGACCHKGKIYSLEGFTNDGENPPALRIIDPGQGVQEVYARFGDYGLNVEPELIDFYGETCFYADCKGNLYVIEF